MILLKLKSQILEKDVIPNNNIKVYGLFVQGDIKKKNFFFESLQTEGRETEILIEYKKKCFN